MEDPTTSLILARFDSQDKVLDRLLSESKRTNGRVTALEAAATVASAMHKAHDKIADQRYKRLELVLPAVCIVVGGVAGNLGHAIGLW